MTLIKLSLAVGATDKCPNKNPPGNVLPDGTLCAKSKWGIFGYAWSDVRVINSRIHDIRAAFLLATTQQTYSLAGIISRH
eukprot:COSAG06_NODE_1700_length_8675_cov_3.485774_8_plen_80_part_00